MRAAELARALGRRGPWPFLAAAIVAQWLALALLIRSINHNGWLFYQGGDQTWFHTSGWTLSRVRLPEPIVGWVWPVLDLPLAALAGPNFLDAAPAIVLFQVALALPLGVLCAYGIASRIGGPLLGYWAAAWWVAAPYAVIPLFVQRYHDRYVDQTLPQALGLTGLADFPSMIVVLGSAYFAVRALDARGVDDALVAGLLAGLAVGLKPANGLFFAAPLLAFAVARRWRSIPAFALASAPGIAVLALWKFRGGDLSVFSPAEVALAAGAVAQVPVGASVVDRLTDYVGFDFHHLNQHFIQFREFFWSARLLEFVPVAGALAVARRAPSIAVLLVTWLLAFFLVKGSAPVTTVESGSFWRLLMPAWPAYFLLGASLPLLVPRVGRSLVAAATEGGLRPPASWSRRVAAAGAAACLVVGVGVAVLPPDDEELTVRIEDRSLYLPVDRRIEVTAAAASGGGVRISWSHPPVDAARPFYVVFRAPTSTVYQVTGERLTDGVHCRDRGGPDMCIFVMDELARSRGRSVVDRPTVGQWSYRVGIAANWLDDPTAGDVVALSPALRVVAGG